MVNDIRGLGQSQLQPTPVRPTNGDAASHATRPQQPGANVDTVTLTGSAKLLNALEAKIDTIPQVDVARVTAIKNEIASGAYLVDSEQVAEQVSMFESDLQGGDGSRVKRDVSHTEVKGGFSVSVTTTSAAGKERSVEATYQFDPASGTASRDVTRTGANGRTVEYHGEVTRTENGFTNEQSVTGPGGQTVTRSVEQSYDAESDTLSRVVTRENDQGQTVERSVTATRTEDGIDVKSSVDVLFNRQG